MKKLLLIALVLGTVMQTTFAQKNLFKKNKKATEKVEEKADEVEKKIEKETKKLEKKADDGKEKVTEMKEEMKEKIENMNEQDVKDAVDQTEKEIDKIDEATEARKADIMEQMKTKIMVTQEEGSISTGLKSGYVVNIKGAETGKVEKHWKKYLKSAFKGKTDLDKDGEILAQSVEIPTVGASVNIYTKVKELKDGASISTYFDTGENYLTSTTNAEGHKLVEKLLYDFGVQERKYAIEQEIEDEEKRLKRLEKDIKNLKNDNQKYHNTIEKAKQDIVENEQEQVEKNAEISNQSIIIDAIKNLLDTVE